MARTWVRLALWSDLILCYLILIWHPQMQFQKTQLGHMQRSSSLRWVMILSRMEFWREGLARQISYSCLVSSRLTSAGQFEGVFSLQIPYLCMCNVRERNMVANAIRVSSIHPVATPCWALDWFFITAPLLLWLKCSNALFHLLPLSVFSLVTPHSGMERSLKSLWPFPAITCRSHVKY